MSLAMSGATATGVSETRGNFPSKPEPKPKPGAIKVVRALYKYTASYPDELSFEEGDVLFVYDRSNPDWWKATCGSQKGLIPSNYVNGKLNDIPEPLHEAARRGNLPFLKECLSQKVSPTGLDAMGNTPLFWASHSGHLDCVRCLLDLPNPPVNAQVIDCVLNTNHFGDTPLHAASAKGHYNIVEALIEAGADPSVSNKDGETPDMLAMSMTIKNLLQKHSSKSSSSVRGIVNPEEYEDDSD